MSGPRIFTYADAIEHLVEFAAARNEEANQRQLRGAIRAAYQEIPMLCDWPTLTRPGRIQMIAPQTTGTVVYSNSARTLTLTDATWPTWCIDAVVRFDDKISHVESRTSSTVVVLDSTMNPGADVASTTYSLFKQWYVLPENFTSLLGPIREDTGYKLLPITMTEMLRLYRSSYSTDKPRYYCIAEAPDLIGSMAMYLYPVKSAAGTLDYIYRRQPRLLRHTGFDANDYAGTIAVTAGSTTVTGTSTAFADTMVGAVIRIGSDATNRPTGLEGEYPFAEERSVSAVVSPTEITLDNNAVTTRSGVKYTVSSPIDLGVSLHNLFMRQCEKHLAQVLNFEHRELIEAYELDARILAMGTRAYERIDDLDRTEWGVPIGDEVSSFE
ncbi:MAG: hypothetical protein U9Q82_11270 [Chloroflexota bacterium]|nr:hypothetical protein [Chloroflexota bacterium]